MKCKIFYPVLAIALFCIFSLPSHAEMQSANYKISTSVFSNGGTPAASTNYQTDSTMGPSSPLMDPSDPPLSDNYGLAPGFWPAAKLIEFTGDLQGTVRFIGKPCEPGAAQSVPPCDGSYPNYEIMVYQDDGVTIAARGYSDANGNYRITLMPGNYIIYTPAGPFVQVANTAAVAMGETMTFDLVIDTGIR